MCQVLECVGSLQSLPDEREQTYTHRKQKQGAKHQHQFCFRCGNTQKLLHRPHASATINSIYVINSAMCFDAVRLGGSEMLLPLCTHNVFVDTCKYVHWMGSEHVTEEAFSEGHRSAP